MADSILLELVTLRLKGGVFELEIPKEYNDGEWIVKQCENYNFDWEERDESIYVSGKRKEMFRFLKHLLV